MRYTKVNNRLVEKYTSIKIANTLPLTGEDLEIILVQGHGVYQYRTNAWVKILNLEADASSGFIGEIRPTIENTLSEEWLECDGSTFNSSTYPDLYNLLGVNTLPDLRACVLYGVGANGTNNLKVYNKFGVQVKNFLDHKHTADYYHTHEVPQAIVNHTHARCTYAMSMGIAYFASQISTYANVYHEIGAGVLFIFDTWIHDILMPKAFLFKTNASYINNGSDAATLLDRFPYTNSGSLTNTNIPTNYSASFSNYGSGTCNPNEFGVKYKIRAKI